MTPYDIVTVARCPGSELIIKKMGKDWLRVVDSEDDPGDNNNYFKVRRDEVLTHREGGYELYLSDREEIKAIASIKKLSEHGVAERSVVAKLLQAVRARRVEEGVLAQHSRWCQSDYSYVNAVPLARDAAAAMYGFVPGRLIDSSTNRRVEEYPSMIAEYCLLLAGRRPPPGV